MTRRTLADRPAHGAGSRVAPIAAMLALTVTAAATLAACAAAVTTPGAPLHYPQTPKADVVDDYFGEKVADPYRWLEALDAPETQAWVTAQNQVSRPLLDALPDRAAIRARLAELWSFDRYSAPARLPSGALVYTRATALANQPVLYIQDPGAEPRVLLDPNTWSADGTEAMVDWRTSPDGRHLAYAVQSGGTDWVEYRVLDIATGTALPDRVGRINFNFDFSRIFWRGGNAGFFYSRFPDPPASSGPAAPPEVANQKIYYHRLGTPQSQDVLIYERPDHPHWFVWGEVTDDGRYLLIYLERNEDTEKEIYVKDLGHDPDRPRLDAPARRLVAGFDGNRYLVGSVGPVVYLRTSEKAPRYRIVAVDVRRPARAQWREVIPQSEEMLQGAHLYGRQIVASYLDAAASRLARYSLNGRPLGDIALEGVGTVAGISGTASGNELYYGFASFSRPTTVYRADLAAGTATPLFAPKLAFDPADYVTEQVFYASADGTQVPLFLTHRKDLRQGPAPTLLYGYGGFANAQTPSFSVPNLVWMERGGVYAQACVRGGNEYGEAWHQGGMLERKQNVFDDFIAAAEFLVREGRTTPAQLAIKGRSNGGLLMGAVVNQRPDLFAAANVGVGVLDMLRYHRFGIAYAWAGDYGRSDDPKMFPVLRTYSPVHNVKPGVEYPAVLVTTADHDDRVHPLHSFKYTAAMQAAQAGDRPVVIRVETRAGHASGGVGTPLTKLIEENADVLAFLTRYTEKAGN
jgi:prolyl oligopeptidase